MSEYLALAGRIREAEADIEHAVQRALHLRDKALRTGDDDYWDGVALSLHGFYTGVEQILEDIARTMEETLPTGPDWHRDLLLQLSAAVPQIRPPVIRRETRHCLDEYRAFRHVVRNVYAFSLRPARLQELTAGLAACFEAVNRDLKDFVTFLEQIAPPDHPGE